LLFAGGGCGAAAANVGTLNCCCCCCCCWARNCCVCVCIACAGAFLTPVATPTNLMVMEPGAYKFTDYWKLGLPMLIWFFIIAVFLVPLIWPFYPAAV
jgi:Na+/H+ antiporter NhaD/arsenite permease-like protein